MVDHEVIRRIAMGLPGVAENIDSFGFSVLNKGKLKDFTHLWRERVDPKKKKVPNPDVLVVVVRNLEEKELLLASDEEKFFTEPHYDGYAAVLVRLNNVDSEEIESLIAEAWRCKAPPELANQLRAD